jgi:periplasmic protein TonB
METNKILTADLLDIIFEGKNKEYGAYEMRKTYNRRLIKSLLIMGAILLFLCAGYFLSGLRAENVVRTIEIDDPILKSIAEPKRQDPIVIPRAPKPQPVEVRTIRDVTVRMVKEDIKPSERPPENAETDNAKIGLANNLNATGDADIVAPPEGKGNGVVAAPKDDDNGGRPFIKVEKESEYPGGLEAWRRYMIMHFRYPEEGVAQGISGVVVVQFIVDHDGNVSEVHAISGPDSGGLRQEAERVIRKSGKWVPAIQNGRPVKSYKTQPVVFKLDEQ